MVITSLWSSILIIPVSNSPIVTVSVIITRCDARDFRFGVLHQKDQCKKGWDQSYFREWLVMIDIFHLLCCAKIGTLCGVTPLI